MTQFQFWRIAALKIRVVAFASGGHAQQMEATGMDRSKVMEQMQLQAEVAGRGKDVTPFNLAATTHIFTRPSPIFAHPGRRPPPSWPRVEGTACAKFLGVIQPAPALRCYFLSLSQSAWALFCFSHGSVNVLMRLVTQLTCLRVVLFLADVLFGRLQGFNGAKQFASMFLDIDIGVVIQVFAIVDGSPFDFTDRRVNFHDGYILGT